MSKMAPARLQLIPNQSESAILSSSSEDEEVSSTLVRDDPGVYARGGGGVFGPLSTSPPSLPLMFFLGDENEDEARTEECRSFNEPLGITLMRPTKFDHSRGDTKESWIVAEMNIRVAIMAKADLNGM
mmetsp:Transcript_44714/g.136417  ORF Transcript_44714/g.136417 Transcript_44714/m.136417 type:complete len:128 (+) Transcript_44714:286-669(+)